MNHILYRLLLRLHPPGFRERFAGDMLDIFDEVGTGTSGDTLIVDAVVSLIRQWLLRRRAWAGIVATTFAGFEFWILGLNVSFSHVGFEAYVQGKPVAEEQRDDAVDCHLVRGNRPYYWRGLVSGSQLAPRIAAPGSSPRRLTMDWRAV